MPCIADFCDNFILNCFKFAFINRLLTQVEEAAKSFESFWKLHKVKLEQCLQLRKFEEDFKQVNFYYANQNITRNNRL